MLCVIVLKPTKGWYEAMCLIWPQAYSGQVRQDAGAEALLPAAWRLEKYLDADDDAGYSLASLRWGARCSKPEQAPTCSGNHEHHPPPASSPLLLVHVWDPTVWRDQKAGQFYKLVDKVCVRLDAAAGAAGVTHSCTARSGSGMTWPGKTMSTTLR